MVNTPLIRDVVPDKATYMPGEAANVTVTIDNHQGWLSNTEKQTTGNRQPATGNFDGEALRGLLVLEVVHLADAVAKLEQYVEVAPDVAGSFVFAFTPPAIPFRGYGLDVTLLDEGGAVLAWASGALDVLERWSQAPRYGFLSDFAPGQEASVEARSNSLARYHLNVVQFYDWMWRHYRLLPPADEFDDALGRRLSLSTVRSAIEAVQARGGAALAYGAVYGAEPEYADRHPELRLYDEAGKPISLAELFYIMNIAPGSPWTELMVSEFAATVRVLGFDGIHLDQYGFPKTGAYDASGESLDLSLHFPPLIDRARAAVAAERAGAGVIFNAVENWPIEAVAPTNQDAVYIEVWSPYVTYNNLRELIREGKRLGGGKQVILAAYLSPFAEADEESRAGAESAALLATSVIAASGGFHLLLGEQDGVLCDPYYPKYATMRPEFAVKMRAYYDFLVRYEELFVGSDVEDWVDVLSEGGSGDTGERVAFAGVAAGQDAESGKVWAIARRKPGYRILHLINLTNQQDVTWNAPHIVPETIEETEVQMADTPPVKQILFLTPDSQRAVVLEWAQQENSLRIKLPSYDVWAVLVCALA